MTDKQAKIIGYAIMSLVGVSFISISRIQPAGNFFVFFDLILGTLLFLSSTAKFHDLSK